MLVITVVMLSGLSALGLEVIWLRYFVFVLGSSILSFSLVLGVLLLAMGLGSLLLPLLVGSRRLHLPALGWILLVLGCTSAATVPLFLNLDLLVPEHLLMSTGGRSLVTALLIFVPGLLMGSILPAASGCLRSATAVGRGIGVLYGANTLGNIAGALLAGYLLIPGLGCSRSIILMAALEAALGLIVLGMLQDRSRVIRLVLPALVIGGGLYLWLGVAPITSSSVFGRPNRHATLVEATEGLRGTVTLYDVSPLPLLARNRERATATGIAYGYRMIAVDGVAVAGTAPDLRTTQKMQAHIPLLLHGSARDVMQIGYGSGETTFEARLHGPRRYHLVEINPDVIRDANRWFPAFAEADYEVFYTDAKSFVRTTRSSYDVILNDSTYPGISGSSQLYSRDHFMACRDRLEQGGIVSTWLPIDLPPETFRMVLATFHSVFPHCSFWLASNCWNKHGVLVGSLTPQDEMLRRLRAGASWPEPVRRSLEQAGYGNPEVLSSFQVLDAVAISRLSEDMEINSDNHPYLEYPARGVQVSGEAFWGETLRLIVQSLSPAARMAGQGQFRRSSATGYIPQLLAGQLALLEGDGDRALRFYRRARMTWPEHPGAANLSADILIFRAQAAFAEGLAALQRNNRTAALAAFEQAVNLCPFSATARFELARLLVEVGRPAEAVPHLRQCLVHSDEILEARILLDEVRGY
jgi:spermidine synthase